MTFLNPIGLAGLLSLPVILALHLLRRRQKPYIVSHLGLWSFLDAETRGPRARRIPLTSILLLDLLIGALLSLAWSRPSVAIAQPGHSPRHYVILLDTSTSMRARNSGGATSRFETAKAEAAGLLQEVTSKDAVTLLTFGQQAHVIADSRQEAEPVDLKQVVDQLDQVQVGETGHALLEALAAGQAALDPSLPAEFHVITDGSFPLPDTSTLRAFAHPLQWHWVGAPVDNQAVLTVNTTPIGAPVGAPSAGSQLQVFARLANFGSSAVTREVILSAGGKELDRASVDLPAGSSVSRIWQIPFTADNPADSVIVSLGSSDALPEDDSAATGLLPAGKVRVALVAETPAPIQQAVEAIPNVDVQLIAPNDYANVLAQGQTPFDLTIFRQFLPAEWPSGQVLIIDPPITSSAAGAQDFLAGPGRNIPAGSLTQVSDTSPLLAGIDFSGVRWAHVWTLANSPAGFTPLLETSGTPILLQGSLARASGDTRQLTLLLADLTQGNFAKHPAYPILMANLVDLAREAPIPRDFKTGQALPMPAPGSYRSMQITPPQQPAVDMDQRWPDHWTDTLAPGLYHFQFTQADGSSTRFTAGGQAGDLVESDLKPREWTQSIAVTNSRTESSPDQHTDQLELRSWLLGAAVLIFLIEAFLAWRR